MNEWQQRRVEFMKNIAQEVTASTNDALVLKGGTSLLLAYGLDRFSEDMDFDGKYPVELENCIERAAGKSGISIESIHLSKDTETTKRYKVHYGAENEHGSYPLKVECSFRQASTINENDVVKIDGIRVYRIEKLAGLKVIALLNREKARDIYDVHFLLKKHPTAFTYKTLEQLTEGISQKGIDILLKTYEDNSKTDHILRNIDGMSIVLELEQSAHQLKEGLQVTSIEDVLAKERDLFDDKDYER
jgi:predicted nucleotidyltransferase component of viral defense system